MKVIVYFHDITVLCKGYVKVISRSYMFSVALKGFQQVDWRWKLSLTGLTLMATDTLTTASLLLLCAGLHASVHLLTLHHMLSDLLTSNNCNNNNKT